VRAQVQAQIVYSFLYIVATGTEGSMQKALDLAHKIEKHGNTSMNSIFLHQQDGAI
jgi:hypothetical protein